MKKKLLYMHIFSLLLTGILVTFNNKVYAEEDFSWTGSYAGLTAGNSWGNSSMQASPQDSWYRSQDISAAAPVLKSLGNQNYSTNGFLGGLEVGYNYQFDQFVAGVEGDFQYVDLSQSRNTAMQPLKIINDSAAFNGSINSNWLSTIRARLGVSSGHLLGFITGGLAIADFSYKAGYGINELGSSYSSTANSSQTLTGWALGSGAEYAFADKWSMKAEYLYVNFQGINKANSMVIGDGVQSAYSYMTSHAVADMTQHIIRVGINYRF